MKKNTSVISTLLLVSALLLTAETGYSKHLPPMNHGITALDRDTGRVAWQFFSNNRVSFAAGRKMIVAADGNIVLGMDPETGKVIWKTKGLNKGPGSLQLYLGMSGGKEIAVISGIQRNTDTRKRRARGWLHFTAAIETRCGKKIWERKGERAYTVCSGLVFLMTQSTRTRYYRGNGLKAVDLCTGEEQWAQNDTGTYAGTRMLDNGSVTCLMFRHALFGIQTDTGKLLWTVKPETFGSFTTRRSIWIEKNGYLLTLFIGSRKGDMEPADLLSVHIKSGSFRSVCSLTHGQIVSNYMVYEPVPDIKDGQVVAYTHNGEVSFLSVETGACLTTLYTVNRTQGIVAGYIADWDSKGVYVGMTELMHNPKYGWLEKISQGNVVWKYEAPNKSVIIPFFSSGETVLCEIKDRRPKGKMGRTANAWATAAICAFDSRTGRKIWQTPGFVGARNLDRELVFQGAEQGWIACCTEGWVTWTDPATGKSYRTTTPCSFALDIRTGQKKKVPLLVPYTDKLIQDRDDTFIIHNNDRPFSVAKVDKTTGRNVWKYSDRKLGREGPLPCFAGDRVIIGAPSSPQRTVHGQPKIVPDDIF